MSVGHMNTGSMNTAQAIGYYAFETIALGIIVAVVAFVAVLALGAVMDRYQRIFRSRDASSPASSALPTPASQNGNI